MVDRVEVYGSKDALDAAVSEIWPDGSPEEWEAAVKWLPLDQRDVVALRLAAITRFVDRRRPDRIDVRRAAELAGLSVPRIYSMAAAWRKRPSVESLGVYVTGKPSRSPRLALKDRKEAIRTIQDLLASDPGISAGDTERALAAAGLKISNPTVVRLLSEQRRCGVPGAFGSRLVLDSAGMDATKYGERLRLFAAIDEGTGLVLGWTTDVEDDDELMALSFAADRARSTLAELDLSGFAMTGGDTAVDVRFHEEAEEGRRVFELMLKNGGVAMRFNSEPAGAALVRAVGDRLDRIWLGVGSRSEGISYRNRRPSRMPEYSEGLRKAIGEAIDAHNSARHALVPATGESFERTQHVRGKVEQVLEMLSTSRNHLSSTERYLERMASFRGV